MKKPSPYLVLVFLLALCFTLSTWLQPRAQTWTSRANSGGLLQTLLGDGQRMFANHYFVKADVYFHSGYYPSIFDQAASQLSNSRHMTEDHHGGKDDDDEHEHEKSMDFLGQPKDWIDRFGRQFYPTTHSHLDKPGEAREILPWLRLSADLDPQRIDTYTVAAYWLRKHLGKPKEAEQFLREGLRANPSSYEILFELGNLYDENLHDTSRARNLWELALKRWQEADVTHQKPDDSIRLEILIHLAALEERESNYQKAIEYREMELPISPIPDTVKKEIEALKQKLATAPPTPASK
jgi:tetratricopeptide (TPR) repeat protein